MADARRRDEWAAALDDTSLPFATRHEAAAAGSDAIPSAGLLALLSVAAERALGQRPFDEQLLACCALLSARAVELDTGEGKTLSGVNPRDEFHRIALREFHGFFDTAYERAARIVQMLTAEHLSRGITALGLRRPSATWTYMISDNPLGNPMDRLARDAGNWWRSRVLRIEDRTPRRSPA